MLGFYNYTVILTYMSLASSVVGVFQSMAGRPHLSIICLMLSGLLDAFDGTVAKRRERTERERKFGIQIDSLSDLFCFGVQPIVIGYAVGMRGLMLWIAVFYLLAALIRLAYFNVIEDELAGQARVFYDGLPVTSVALILPVIYSFRRLIGRYFSLVYTGALLLIAICFVLRFRIKKFKLKGIFLLVGIGIVELLWLVLGRKYGII